MKTKNYFHFSVFLILSLSLCTCLTIGRAFHCFAQGAAINSTGAAANNSAMLDVSSTNQGIRIPRVKLLSTTDVTTILNPTNSLLVFDSLAAGDITTPGFFYWDASNTKWVKLLTTGTGWQLTGNSGTDSTANFIGTTDSRPLVIKTNNTEKIRVMANGNVGIGTTNPNYKFQVNDYSTGILNLLKLQNTNTVGVGTGSRAVFSDVNNVAVGMITSKFDGTNWILNLGTNDFDPIVTLKNGNVGIGTSIPVSPLNIVGVGDIPIILNRDPTGVNYINRLGFDYVGTFSNNDFRLFSNATVKMTISTSGNVGIGTTSPGAKLNINGTLGAPAISGYTQTYGLVRVQSGDGALDMGQYANGDSWIQNAAPSSLNVSRNIIINPNGGNVGIGTTAPASSLHIAQSTGVTIGEDKTTGTANTAGTIKYVSAGDNAYYTSFTAGTQTANATYTLPTSDGTPGQVLSTNGSGILSWVSASSFTCGVSFAVVHTAGTVAPVSKTVTYSTILTDLTGSNKCWITQNLGADHQASSATDATEASAGWYWQFNRMQGYKHDGTTRTPSSTWNTTQDNSYNGWDPAKDPCTALLGASWRIPTHSELTAADANGGWSSYTATYNSPLKLHAAGLLGTSNNGSILYRGTEGYYFDRTAMDATNGGFIDIASTYCGMAYTDKALGFSLRCIKD